VKLVLLIVAIGTIGGTLLGIKLGKGLGNIYMEFTAPYFLSVLRLPSLPWQRASRLLLPSSGRSIGLEGRPHLAGAAMRPRSRPGTEDLRRTRHPARILSQPTRMICGTSNAAP